MDELEIYLYKAFHDFISLCNESEKVYLLDSNVNPPKGPYMGVKVDAITPVSWATGEETIPTDITGLTEFYSSYVGRILLVSYGDNALSRMQKVATGLRERNTTKPLKDKGVAYSGSSQVVDISAPVDGTKIEKRATMTVNINFVQGGSDRGDETSGVIDEANVEGTYLDPC